MPTVYQFDYKGHPVKAVEKDGKGYIFAPDIMPLLGYDHPLDSLKPFAERKDKIYTFYGIPVISSSIFNVISYPKRNKKKTQKLKEWVDSVVFPAVQGQIVMPDEVFFDWWEEEDCKKYFEEVKEAEEQGLYVKKPKKTTLEFEICGETVAKAKIDTKKCTITEALGELLVAALFKKYDGEPNCSDAAEMISEITTQVISTIQEDWINRLDD